MQSIPCMIGDKLWALAQLLNRSIIRLPPGTVRSCEVEILTAVSCVERCSTESLRVACTHPDFVILAVDTCRHCGATVSYRRCW